MKVPENMANLPEQWQRAFQRDRQGVSRGNDPAPERRAGRLLAGFIVTGLGVLLLPGTLLGVWNLVSIAEHRSGTAARTAWIQAHGQAQLFGWVGTFILGISLYILPKFLGRFMTCFWPGWTVWGLWTAGVVWRWWAGISARYWRTGLVASAVLELAAYGLAQHILWFASGADGKRAASAKKPRDLASWLGFAGFLALGVALLVNLGVSVKVALHAELPVYPPVADRMLLQIALWGFAVPVAWGYSTRFVTIFLGLKPPFQSAAAWLSAGVLLVVACALLRQFLLADLLALALTLGAVWTLRVFLRSAREPKRVGVYKHYDVFIRLAYAWLIVGAILGVLADALPHEAGLGGASRHAVTVGFLAMLIFAIGPRILPTFLNGRELWSPRWMAASLWLISLGCLLRVSTEAVAYSSSGFAWKVLPVSAILELAAVVLFVVNLVMTVSEPLLAWFDPDSITADLPLYFYVTSFPKTRQLLVRAGLSTLAQVRRVPRALSLGEAAAADGVETERLLSELRIFFQQRQPRRLGRK